MEQIITGRFAPLRSAIEQPSSLRIVDWNIDRGLRLKGIIEFLASTNADVLILQEVDINARRTHRKNIAEEIARNLQMNYVFGVEFQELVQGSKTSPAYQGQATLSRWPISDPRLIDFARQSNFWKPRWYLPRIEPFQERLGGRVALAAEISIAGGQFITYNLHLESRGNNELRFSQLQGVLSDAAYQDPRRSIVIAGDLNFDVSMNGAASAIARAGFDSAITGAPTATTPPRGLLEPGRRIDWAFVRGPLQARAGQVHNKVKASDHFPISFTLSS